MPRRFFGYEERDPYESEKAYFESNKGVSGMASEDGRIVFNPYSVGADQDSVGRNEAVRLYLREMGIKPSIDITDEQIKRFKGTPYEGAEDALRATILARIVSGDESAGKPTKSQGQAAELILRKLKEKEEFDFLKWYKPLAKMSNMDLNPYDPGHKYDYKGAWSAGIDPVFDEKDNRYHWDSRFKADDHPARWIDGYDTKAIVNWDDRENEAKKDPKKRRK